jgi:hypothetical protein
LAFSLGLSGFFVPGRLTVTSGGSLDFEAVTRVAMSTKHRFEAGVELRGVLTTDVTQYAVGVPLRFVFGVGSNFELTLGFTPGYYRVVFDSPYFQPVSAFGFRFGFGMQFPIGSRVALGFSPISFLALGSPDVDVLFAYEPRFWLGVAFF